MVCASPLLVIKTKKSISSTRCFRLCERVLNVSCYTTAQDDRWSESVPGGSCSYHYRFTTVSNCWQQPENKHHGADNAAFFVCLSEQTCSGVGREILTDSHDKDSLSRLCRTQRLRWYHSVIHLLPNLILNSFSVPQGDLGPAPLTSLWCCDFNSLIQLQLYQSISGLLYENMLPCRAGCAYSVAVWKLNNDTNLTHC